MSAPKTVTSSWIERIAEVISSARHGRGLFVALGAYRLDLVRVMADELDLQFFDFRNEILQPLGWDAGRLPLAALSEEIETRRKARSLVVHNAEALLATKAAADRKQWFAQFANQDWKRPVIIPLAIYQNELPVLSGPLVRIETHELPSECLLLLLAGKRMVLL